MDGEVDPYEAVTEDDTDAESDSSSVLGAEAGAQITQHRSLHISSMSTSPTVNPTVPENDLMDMETQPLNKDAGKSAIGTTRRGKVMAKARARPRPPKR